MSKQTLIDDYMGGNKKHAPISQIMKERYISMSRTMVRLIDQDIKSIEMYYSNTQRSFRNKPDTIMIESSDIICFFDLSPKHKEIQLYLIDILNHIQKWCIAHLHGDEIIFKGEMDITKYVTILVDQISNKSKNDILIKEHQQYIIQCIVKRFLKYVAKLICE